MSLPFVSVIIPVFNNSDQLKVCLQALEEQTYPDELYEVIVIDNASDDPVEPIVSLFKHTRLAYEQQPGSYVARNKGIGLARGKIIAFTDSDCIPSFEWIEKGVEVLIQTPNCGLVAGKINLFFKDPNHPTAVELYESITALKQKKFIEEYQYGVTANLFTLKEVIDQVGVFQSNLKSHGDLEWGNRVFKAGYIQRYSAQAYVDHPARLSIKDLYLKTVRLTGGDYMIKKKRSLLYFLLDFCRDILPPIKFIWILLKTNKQLKFNQKMNVIGIRWLVKYISAYERIKMQLGATAQR